MAVHRFLSAPLLLLVSIAVAALIGCSAPPVKMPEQAPTIVRQHASVRVMASYPGLKKTGIYLNRGDFYTVLADGEVNTNPKRYPGRWQGPGSRLRVFVGDLPIGGTGVNSVQESSSNGEISFIVRDGNFNYDRKGAQNPEWYKTN